MSRRMVVTKGTGGAVVDIRCVIVAGVLSNIAVASQIYTMIPILVTAVSNDRCPLCLDSVVKVDKACI